MTRLLQDPAEAARLDAAGRRFYKTRVLAAEFVRRYHELYTRIGNGEESPGPRGADGQPCILMLRPPLTAEGPVPQIAELLAGALRELGCGVDLACWGASTSDGSLLRRSMRCAVDLRHVHRLVRRLHPDVLFVHTAHDSRALARDLPLLRLARRHIPSTVVLLHGSYSHLLGQPGHALLAGASQMLAHDVDLLLVLSTAEREQWRRFNSHVRVERVDNAFVPQAVQVTEYRPSGTAFRLLFVGRIMREKGVFEVLDAVCELRHELPITLTVVGNGPDSVELAADVDRRNLGNCVTLSGRLGSADVQRAYVEADVFVFPTYYREGFPTVLSEAMAAGLPIVTTRIRGAADHLQDRVHALFVAPRDSRALAEALRQLRADDRLRQRMAVANRIKVAEFAPSLVAPRYLELIQTALGETQSSDVQKRGERGLRP